MEKYQSLFSYLKTMKTASLILVSAALAVACSSGGSGSTSSTSVVNGNIVGELGSTSGFVNGGQLLYDTVSDYGQPAYPSVELSLQFYGFPTNSIGGIIAVQGVMTVQDTSCGLPVGQYQVETSTQAGQYQVSNGTLVYIPYLVANGPASITFSLPYVSIIQPNTAINHDVYGVQHQFRMANYSNNYNGGNYAINIGYCQATFY